MHGSRWADFLCSVEEGIGHRKHRENQDPHPGPLPQVGEGGRKGIRKFCPLFQVFASLCFLCSLWPIFSFNRPVPCFRPIGESRFLKTTPRPALPYRVNARLKRLATESAEDTEKEREREARPSPLPSPTSGRGRKKRNKEVLSSFRAFASLCFLCSLWPIFSSLSMGHNQPDMKKERCLFNADNDHGFVVGLSGQAAELAQ